MPKLSNKLYAHTTIQMLDWLDDAKRCYHEGLPKTADNYIALIRNYLLEAAISDVEVEPISAPIATVPAESA